MKKIIGLLLVSMLLLTACASSTTIAPNQQETATGEKPSTQTSSGSDQEKMLQQVEADTLAKNDKQQELFLPINSKTAKKGEQVAFGLVLNPINKPRDAYFARVSFIEARDRSSNKIEVDKATVAQWIRESQTSDFTVAAGGSYYIPVVITVKDMKAGVAPTPGSYQFEVQLYERIDNNFDNKLDKLLKNVYVKVE